MNDIDTLPIADDQRNFGSLDSSSLLQNTLTQKDEDNDDMDNISGNILKNSKKRTHKDIKNHSDDIHEDKNMSLKRKCVKKIMLSYTVIIINFINTNKDPSNLIETYFIPKSKLTVDELEAFYNVNDKYCNLSGKKMDECFNIALNLLNNERFLPYKSNHREEMKRGGTLIPVSNPEVDNTENTKKQIVFKLIQFGYT